MITTTMTIGEMREFTVPTAAISSDLVVLVRQKENLGSLFRIAIVIEIQKIVGAFSPNSGIIVEKCFINF